MSESNTSKLIGKSIIKRISKISVDELRQLAFKLEISIDKEGKKTKKTKIELISDIREKLLVLTFQEQVSIMKETNIGFELEVKNILEELEFDSIDDLIKTCCLPLDVFLEKNPSIKEKFINSCDLENINDTIKSTNCVPCKCQGLYALSIEKEGIHYIVKLGSFAESQGMSKRITSFGGGNYVTGSATNKWFQKFIKIAMFQGYTSKFTYYNNIQEEITIMDLDNNPQKIIPYVTRQHETQLFEKYNKTNHNITPIFGSNCL